MFELMKQNITLNGLNSKVSASIYDWGESVPVALPQHPDIILAADCVYFEPAFPLLQKTLQDLIGDSTYQNISCSIPNVSNNIPFLFLLFLSRIRSRNSTRNLSYLPMSFSLSYLLLQSRLLTLFHLRHYMLLLLQAPPPRRPHIHEDGAETFRRGRRDG